MPGTGARYARNRSISCGVVASRGARGSQEYAQRARDRAVQRNQQGHPRPHQVCGGGHRQDPFQTTTLPVKSHTEFIDPIWHLKQRVGMHLFRTGMAFNLIGFTCAWAFPNLLRLPRATASFATGRCTPPPNRSCITGGQVHRHPVSMRQWQRVHCRVGDRLPLIGLRL